MIQAGGLCKHQEYHAVYRYGGWLALPQGNQLLAGFDTTDFYT